MAQMRRQSLVKFDAPLCETIVDTPKPQGKEVLVRIERCGLCHSDLHAGNVGDRVQRAGRSVEWHPKVTSTRFWGDFIPHAGTAYTGGDLRMMRGSRAQPHLPPLCRAAVEPVED